MILTVDVGSSFTKSALVDEEYELHAIQKWPTEYAQLSQSIEGLVSKYYVNGG